MVATLDRFSLEGGIQGMKKRFFVTLLVGLFTALSAAWAQEGTQEAAVRVVHLVPNGPNVDITLNGETALQGLAAGTVSGYVSVPAGQYDVEVLAAGEAGLDADVADAEAEAEVEEVEGVAPDVGTDILGGANVVGLADETPYLVTGPEGYEQEFVGDQQLVDLTPGTYTFAGELDGQPLERQVEVVGDQVVEVNLLDDQTALTDTTVDTTVDTVGTDAAVGVDQAVVQESLQAMPALFATIRETINLQDYELAQDQIEEAQQLVQNVGGVGTEAVLPTLELVQEQLQTAQEALGRARPGGRARVHRRSRADLWSVGG